MKRWIAISLGMQLMMGGVAWGASADKPKTREEVEQEKLAELDGSEWKVTLTPRSGKGSPVQDKLVFENRKVSLKSFEKNGYGPTAFSLTVREDAETATWETFQLNAKGALSIRGDWQGDVMNGIVSESLEDGKKITTWAFSSQEKAPLKSSGEQAPAGVAAALTDSSGKDSSVKKIGSALVSREKSSG